MSKEREITKTDGTRSISVSKSRYSGIDIAVCLNGWQTTVVRIDDDMLQWMVDAVAEFAELPE
ncbi:MAG: hypothetical protein MZV65_39560 [Chromatiales bacterium]|nr:hypothetical protein [Chromatiales bacterium]MCK7581134.1 hypothetical protein [Chromatiales bacterium]